MIKCYEAILEYLEYRRMIFASTGVEYNNKSYDKMTDVLFEYNYGYKKFIDYLITDMGATIEIVTTDSKFIIFLKSLIREYKINEIINETI